MHFLFTLRHTTKQDSYFCRICGYPNLRRIPVTLHEDGQLEFHFAKKFVKNLRGTKVGYPWYPGICSFMLFYIVCIKVEYVDLNFITIMQIRLFSIYGLKLIISFSATWLLFVGVWWKKTEVCKVFACGPIGVRSPTVHRDFPIQNTDRYPPSDQINHLLFSNYSITHPEMHRTNNKNIHTFCLFLVKSCGPMSSATPIRWSDENRAPELDMVTDLVRRPRFESVPPLWQTS